jgi:glycosyltransferase involved in cell wall biosynthesis
MPYPDTPANRYRLPTRLADYAAAGLPVVTQDVGDMREFVGGHGAGVVLPANALDLVEGVRALEEEGRRDGAARKARRLAEERFSPDLQAKELEGFFEGLLANRRTAK